MASEAAGAASRPVTGGGSGRANRPSLRKAFDVFENCHYRYLWASSTFSFAGMQMQQVARALLAWHLTQSYGAVGAVSLSFGLPMMLFALIGGSLADRLEKRNLTLMTQTATGLLALLTAVMVATGVMTIEWLLIIGLVQGTFFTFGMPARTPLMAEVVGPANVMSAIAMSNAAMNATRLFGPALAGVLVAAWGLDAAYFATAAASLLGAATILRVPTGLGGGAGGASRRVQGNMFVEIGRGLRYVATHPRLRLLIGMLFILTFFANPYIVLLPGFVQEELGKGEGAFGLLQSMSGLGALVGSLTIASLTESDRKPLIQWLAGLLGGLGLVALAVGSSLFGYAGALAATIFIGVFLTAYQTLNNTMLMDEADPAYYGRVMSINMVTFSAMPMMAFPLGAVADAVGARETFVAEGLVVLGFMAFVALANGRYTFSRMARRPQPVRAQSVERVRPA